MARPYGLLRSPGVPVREGSRDGKGYTRAYGRGYGERQRRHGPGLGYPGGDYGAAHPEACYFPSLLERPDEFDRRGPGRADRQMSGSGDDDGTWDVEERAPLGGVGEDDGTLIRDSAAPSPQFTWPVAMIMDREQNLLVSDEALPHRINSMTTQGEFLAKSGADLAEATAA